MQPALYNHVSIDTSVVTHELIVESTLDILVIKIDLECILRDQWVDILSPTSVYQFRAVLLDCHSQVVITANYYNSWNDSALSCGMSASCKLFEI